MLKISLDREKRTDSGYPPDHTVLLSHINKYVTTLLLITSPELKFYRGMWDTKHAESKHVKYLSFWNPALNVHFNTPKETQPHPRVGAPSSLLLMLS